MQLLKDSNSNNTKTGKTNEEEKQEEEILKLSTISIPLLNIVGDQDDLTPSSFINTSE